MQEEPEVLSAVENSVETTRNNDKETEQENLQEQESKQENLQEEDDEQETLEDDKNSSETTHNDQETKQENLQEPEDEHENFQDDNKDEMPPEVKSSRQEKALLEFRRKLENAILNHKILGKEKGRISSTETQHTQENLKDIKLWGVPLFPSKNHESTDVVLTKFLKAKDFKVSEAFNLLQRTLKWRSDMNIDRILDEHFGDDLEKVGYIGCKDKKGHRLCFNSYGVYKNKERLGTTDGKSVDFLRWKIQFVEKCIQTLDLKPGGVSSVVWIIDLKHAPAPAMKELPFFSRKVLTLFRDHYPGIIHRYVIINVPLWILAYHAFQLRLLTQRSKSKFIFVRPYRVAETLVKFIAPEYLPVQYGGLKREIEEEFSSDDQVLMHKVRANAMENIHIPVTEAGMTVYWEITVVGYEVSYKEEFVPDDDCSYRILVNKEKRMGKSVKNSFHIREPGTIVLSIENATFKKKVAFYRYSIKPTVTNLNFLKKDDPLA